MISGAFSAKSSGIPARKHTSENPGVGGSIPPPATVMSLNKEPDTWPANIRSLMQLWR